MNASLTMSASTLLLLALGSDNAPRPTSVDPKRSAEVRPVALSATPLTPEQLLLVSDLRAQLKRLEGRRAELETRERALQALQSSVRADFEALRALEKRLDARLVTEADRQKSAERSERERAAAEAESRRADVERATAPPPKLAAPPTPTESETLASTPEQRVGRLAKMIERMKPRDAASFLAATPEALAAQALGALDEARAAKILAALPPAQAVRLTRRFVGGDAPERRRSAPIATDDEADTGTDDTVVPPPARARRGAKR